MWGTLKGECVEILEDLWIWGRLMSDEAVGLGKNSEKNLLACFSFLLLSLLFLCKLQARDVSVPVPKNGGTLWYRNKGIWTPNLCLAAKSIL